MTVPAPAPALVPLRRRLFELSSLAWPAILSYILNNAYRVNDQFWIQGLGEEAQAAIGTTFFVQVLLFSAVFLAVGGALALVSRATGASDPGRRDSIVRHSLFFGLLIGVVLTGLLVSSVDGVVALLGLQGGAAGHARDYLGTIGCFMVALSLFPVVDAIFIARGNTRVPMVLQCLAVALNWFLNPILIYGADAAERVSAPGVGLSSAVARAFDVEGTGTAGAALATGIARTLVLLLGLLVLRFGYGTRLFGSLRPKLATLGAIARISVPASVSIAIYALAYWLVIGVVLVRLDVAVKAGLGVGFQVFEGLAFPCYLGVSIAGASLVGRAIGARDPAGALEVVRAARILARIFGVAFAALFLLVGPLLVPLFTDDASVERETLLYVTVLAFSQYWVAVETVNEKVLLGSGSTGAIFWIAPLGNLLRLPIAWVLAFGFGFGAAGVWWAINLSTYLKAFLFWRRVQEGGWLTRALRASEPAALAGRVGRPGARGAP